MSYNYKINSYLLIKRVLTQFLNIVMPRYFVKRLPPDSWISAIVNFRSIDSHERFVKITKLLKQTNSHRILDVGSGSTSPLRERGFQVLSIDIRHERGLDIIASATHLPFRNQTFDCVTAVDTIEHIKYNEREKALADMKRCGEKVIIHTPLQDGKTFLGRVGDLAMLDFCRKLSSTVEQNTYEHVINGEPSPAYLETRQFMLMEPDWNLSLWLAFMKPTFVLFNLASPVISILYLLVLRKIKHPPYWGGYFKYEQTDQKY